MPTADWRPDPAWGPAPPGWQFWVEDAAGAAPTAPPGASLPVTELLGEDGRAFLDGDHLVLVFADQRSTADLKRAVRLRAYPLTAVANIHVDPDGHRGHPTLRVLPHPGADLLRPLLKDPQPGADSDPDTLILRKGGTVPQAEAFAATVRARAAAAGTPAGPVLVDNGRLPLTVSGANTRATFDGTTVTLEVSSWTASAAKKNSYPRRLPASAITDVAIAHPKMSGQLRFVLAGGPGHEAPVDPKTDLDTVELHADNSQSYAVLAAAVLTAGRRAGVTVHPELLPAAPPPPTAPEGAPRPTPGPGDAAATGTLPASVPTSVPAAEAMPAAPPSPRPSPLPRHAAPDIVPTTAVAPAAAAPVPPPAAPAPLPPPGKPGWRERRAEKKAAEEHAAAVATWQAEQATLDDLARAAARATRPEAGGGIEAGIMLKTGEVALWSGLASLVEPRRQQGHYAGAYSGVSFRIAKGVRYTVGGSRGHYVPGPEVQTPIDIGRAVITTHRVVFSGAKANREWMFSKLVSMDFSAGDTTVLISVSNRQKVSGLHLGKTGTEFTNFLAMGVAISQHGAAAVAADCQQTAAAHRTALP